LLGMVIGAGVALFTTPKTGDETRQDISNRWHSALEQGKRAAREREQQLWADFNTRVKAPADIPINAPPTSPS
jgi:gas vesicle protein